MVTVAMGECPRSPRRSNGGGAVAEVVDLRLGLNNGKAHGGQLEIIGSKPAEYSKREEGGHRVVLWLMAISNHFIFNPPSWV